MEGKQMTVKILIPYFGKFPDQIDLFLESCRYNPEFSFVFITDQKPIAERPSNVEYYNISFDQLNELICRKLGRQARIYSPYKLCDYKPIYGFIFSEIIGEADFWGHCDIDLIFGKISNFLSLDMLAQYEKIQTQGHFILYKNSERMNEMFKQTCPAGIMFNEMIKHREPCFFDEIMFPAICREHKVRFFECRQFADILPQYSTFRISPMECDLKDVDGQFFFWDHGELYRESCDGRDQLLYIHLQKRKLPTIYSDFTEKIFFTPRGIVAESKYNKEYELPNEEQGKIYSKNRWRSLTIGKIWIHWKIRRLRTYEKRNGIS